MRTLPVFIAVLGFLHAELGARVWTSSDGRELEAEFLSGNQAEIKVRRKSDQKVLTLRLDSISVEDKAWLAAKNAGPADAAEVKPAVELPKKIAEIVKAKGELVFEDDFNREDKGEKDDLGEAWNTNSDSRAKGDKQNDLAEGVLVMTISPKADHAISTRTTVDKPFRDVVVALRMLLPAGGSLKLAYNDREYKAVHAGHINGVTVTPTSISLADERTGRFNLKYENDKSSPEAKAAMASSEKRFPIDLKTDKWYEVVTYHEKETLTVFIDGKEVASFSSPGFGHPTKRDLAFAVPKSASVDDLKIWAIKE